MKILVPTTLRIEDQGRGDTTKARLIASFDTNYQATHGSRPPLLQQHSLARV
jgi:hypothetical protein